MNKVILSAVAMLLLGTASSCTKEEDIMLNDAGEPIEATETKEKSLTGKGGTGVDQNPNYYEYYNQLAVEVLRIHDEYEDKMYEEKQSHYFATDADAIEIGLGQNTVTNFLSWVSEIHTDLVNAHVFYHQNPDVDRSIDVYDGKYNNVITAISNSLEVQQQQIFSKGKVIAIASRPKYNWETNLLSVRLADILASNNMPQQWSVTAKQALSAITQHYQYGMMIQSTIDEFRAGEKEWFRLAAALEAWLNNYESYVLPDPPAVQGPQTKVTFAYHDNGTMDYKVVSFDKNTPINSVISVEGESKASTSDKQWIIIKMRKDGELTYNWNFFANINDVDSWHSAQLGQATNGLPTIKAKYETDSNQYNWKLEFVNDVTDVDEIIVFIVNDAWE